MKSKQIYDKYEKLAGEFGKSGTKMVEAFEAFTSDPSEETLSTYEEATAEFESMKTKFYSFADQEWK